MKKKLPETFTENFTINPEQGAAAALSNISKPGYHVETIQRIGTNAKVTFRINALVAQLDRASAF